jgi:hypothetical protein
MVDVYNTEAERRAAIQEVTALRRQFDTTTAKGAKAFAKDPAAQAALKRLDAAKSAAGMRTSAQDLAALNRITTSDTATGPQRWQGRMTTAPTKAERDVTKQLNAPSKQYFKQVQQAYKNPDVVPTWKPPKEITPDILTQYDEAGWNASKARFDWVLIEDNQGRPRWAMGVIGALRKPPTEIKNPNDAMQYWMSDGISVGEMVRNIIPQVSGGRTWDGTLQNINFNELAEAIPEIKYSEFQEIMHQLSLAKDEDITIEDILDKYDEMFGEG